VYVHPRRIKKPEETFVRVDVLWYP